MLEFQLPAPTLYERDARTPHSGVYSSIAFIFLLCRRACHKEYISQYIVYWFLYCLPFVVLALHLCAFVLPELPQRWWWTGGRKLWSEWFLFYLFFCNVNMLMLMLMLNVSWLQYLKIIFYHELTFLWLRRRRWKNKSCCTSRPGCIVVELLKWSCKWSVPVKVGKINSWIKWLKLGLVSCFVMGLSLFSKLLL